MTLNEKNVEKANVSRLKKKRATHLPNGTPINWDSLNHTPVALPMQVEYNVYRAIEAYAEDWVHKEDKHGNFIEAYPKPNTRRRSDLPSLAEQWRTDAKARRKKHDKSTRGR